MSERTTLETLLKQVEELDAKGRESQTHSEYECIVWELARATPVLVEVIRKLGEQRNHYHAICYRDLEPAVEDNSLRKRNSDLDAIVAKRLGEAR